MNIFLVRVALSSAPIVVSTAESSDAQREAEGSMVPEAHRYLSAEGRRLIRALGHTLRENEQPSFDRIIASPLATATQTAELFADRVDYLGVVEVLPGLAGGTPPHVMAPNLLASGATLAVIADEPALSELGAFLIGRPTFPQSLHAQVSVIIDRQPAWCMRAGEKERRLLLVA